jgi:uncharacterized protein GlcG (DUF336 family)
MKLQLFLKAGLLSAGGLLVAVGNANAICPVSQPQLANALSTAAGAEQSGFNNNFWAVVVDREGVVCAVAFSGPNAGAQWLLSRQIAAAKAFTANGLSLDRAPLSTGQLYSTVQPGAPQNPLFGVAAGNPVDPAAAYDGSYSLFGTATDPMVGKRVGGTITFGGGLGLYSGIAAQGGLGVSGDTACADHSLAWRLRNILSKAPSAGSDVIHLTNATQITKFGDHPGCPNDGATQGTN